MSTLLPQRPEDGVGSLELKLQVALSTPVWVLGTEFKYSGKAANPFNPEPLEFKSSVYLCKVLSLSQKPCAVHPRSANSLSPLIPSEIHGLRTGREDIRPVFQAHRPAEEYGHRAYCHHNG